MNLLVHFVIYGHSWHGSCNFENFQNITRAHKSRNALAFIRFPILITHFGSRNFDYTGTAEQAFRFDLFWSDFPSPLQCNVFSLICVVSVCMLDHFSWFVNPSSILLIPDALLQNHGEAVFPSLFPNHLRASHFAAIFPFRGKKIQKNALYFNPWELSISAFYVAIGVVHCKFTLVSFF